MNRDYVLLEPGQEAVLADIQGAGRINHLYCILIDPTCLAYRKMVLRMYWDGETSPSVEAPLGDFFCISHGLPRPVRSLLVTVNPGNGGAWCPSSFGLNSYFPMPFSKQARITLEYPAYTDRRGYPLMFWYHVDYEEGAAYRQEQARFHAQWRRNPLTRSADPSKKNVPLWDGVNLDGKENYRILKAKGQGQVIGMHLQIDNVAGGWYGEGDDMVFIDGRKWPPALHGTGTEEIFGGGACPSSEYSGPYSGFQLIENENFSGKNGMYRWYVNDPLRFRESIELSIEHGHANNFENDYSSVAYWYQVEPHERFEPLPSVEGRLPRVPEALLRVEDRIAEILTFQKKLEKRYGESDAFGLTWKFISDGAQAIRENRLEDALGIYQGNLSFLNTYVL